MVFKSIKAPDLKSSKPCLYSAEGSIVSYEAIKRILGMLL